MKFGIYLSALFLLVFGVSLQSNSTPMVDLLVINSVVQLLLFVLVACVPFLRTGRMSYVDIAWPFGVALIGAQVLLFADGDVFRKTIVGCVYLPIGLRMGIGAIGLGLKTGVIFNTEFPRYEYRKMLMSQEGNKYLKFHIVSEIMVQGFANMSVLALPAFMVAINPTASISTIEIVGMTIWAIAYMLESVADAQKLVFISKNEGGVCNIGLWKYSRHPNYFAEWLVWTGVVVASIPSWLALQSIESSLVWIFQGFGAILASVMLYVTLNFLTGVKPAEYYSAKKRPGYKAYQKNTSPFFPWFPKS